MYKKILLPVDGSRASEAVVPYVAQLARSLGAGITLLHVTVPPHYPAMWALGDEYVVLPQSESDDIGEPYLEELATGLRNKGLSSVNSIMATGSPSLEIRRIAEDGEYDLIAMSTHGRSGVGRWVFGSTADKVLHTTTLPLLLARPDAAAERKAAKAIASLVVPLDGSRLAELAVPVATTLAQRMSLRVTLVRVIPPFGTLYDGFEPAAYDPRLDKELEATARDYVAMTSAKLRQAGIPANYAVERGLPSTQIIDRAETEGDSLIVMSTHGRGGIGRWVLGSVADRVLRAASGPVLLLRSKADLG